MREAIGSSLIFNLIIAIVIIMIAVLVGSLAYSKAFKVKNRIINIIETNKGFNQDEIDSELSKMGYKVTRENSCENIDGTKLLTQNNLGSNYDYCVYEIATYKNDEEHTEGNKYYKVKTYMYFDIPVINKLLKFPVWGETKVFYDTYINYEE